MNAGTSQEEIVEILLQVSIYTGVPASMSTITAAKKAQEVNEKGRPADVLHGY